MKFFVSSLSPLWTTTRIVGGQNMTIVNINGRDHSVSVPDEMPLLWLIRDHLQDVNESRSLRKIITAQAAKVAS
jgi:aerobic-type carbon monoxide dehydrogenase small subunit (CoxS/CutS family)